jgi:hypothetical protein
MKRNSNVTRRTIAALLLSILLISSTDALAGMAVSPLQQWVTVKPGNQASFSITVTNTVRSPDTPPCVVSVSLVDFAVSPQGKLSFGARLKHDRSAVEWITFNAGEFMLEPGESKEIKATVSAPINADGDYWAAYMVKLVNPDEHQQGVRVNLQTASGIFVHVARRNYIERGSVIDANVIIPKFGQEEILAEESAWGRTIQEAEEEGALRINTELKNDGLVAFIADGKAFLYSGKWRRAASIPLYTSRRRIFPGHTRVFTGIMSQPLPAGQYKLRVFFDFDSKYGRKITRDQWTENFQFNDVQALEGEPQEIELALTGGRFTTSRFLISNQGLYTVAVRCWLQCDGLLQGWLELESPEFTLAQNMRRNVVCSVRIPQDAEPGQYDAIINAEVERSGLTVKGKSNVELHKIPIRVVVTKSVAVNK